MIQKKTNVEETPQEREELEEVNMMTTAIYLYEAADSIVRAAEKKFHARKMGLHHKLRKNCSDIIESLQRLEWLCEQFSPIYGEIFGDRTGKVYQNIQEASNWYALFALLAGDRLNTKEKEKKMINYLAKFKDNGHISTETLQGIKLK